MDTDVYPCIIYQRMRPSCPEASHYAWKTIWPLSDDLVAHEGYKLSGLYGDSEFAPPFCGGSEIRPAFEIALRHARKLAAKAGNCALLIGNADAIGDGDPYLPAYNAADHEAGVDIRLVNFFLRPHARSTNLRSAWRYFHRHQPIGRETAAPIISFEANAFKNMIEVLVQRAPGWMLAHLYLANPTSTPVSLRWAQHLRSDDPHMQKRHKADWHDLVIPGSSAARIETIFQGELPWVRQLRLRCEIDGRKAVGSAHLMPGDLTRDRVSFTWEDRGET